MHGINKELMNVPCLLVKQRSEKERQGTLVIKIHTLKNNPVCLPKPDFFYFVRFSF